MVQSVFNFPFTNTTGNEYLSGIFSPQNTNSISNAINPTFDGLNPIVGSTTQLPAITPSFGESLGNGNYKDAFTNLFKGGMTPKTRTGISPAGTAMGIANAGMNTIMGGFNIANMLNNQKLAKQSYLANLASYNQNSGNQVKSYNAQLDSNARAAAIREGRPLSSDQIHTNNADKYLTHKNIQG